MKKYLQSEIEFKLKVEEYINIEHLKSIVKTSLMKFSIVYYL